MHPRVGGDQHVAQIPSLAQGDVQRRTIFQRLRRWKIVREVYGEDMNNETRCAFLEISDDDKDPDNKNTPSAPAATASSVMESGQKKDSLVTFSNSC